MLVDGQGEVPCRAPRGRRETSIRPWITVTAVHHRDRARLPLTRTSTGEEPLAETGRIGPGQPRPIFVDFPYGEAT
ncbi:hypothetical protein [Streptomyces sp. NPDC057257]|uniref:hypothetical protein n=1 Tax=Streptomyces sp. NPDC057257 TaxID=3346071 RepID=UPI00363214AA